MAGIEDGRRHDCEAGMTATPVLDAACLQIAADARRDRRVLLRAWTANYERKAGDLFHWTSPETRDAIRHAIENPASLAATKALCKAAYRDWRAAFALPRWYRIRQMTIDNRRLLFACECELYRQQRNRYRRAPGTDAWLNETCNQLLGKPAETPEAAE